MYMNQGDIVQIEAPNFDPNIDGDSLPCADEKPNEVTIQGTLPTNPEVTESDEENRYTPATNTAQSICQETDWPDAIPIQIPRIYSSTAQPEEQGPNRHQAQYYAANFEILKLEDNSEEEQFADLDSYMAHHNTHQASQQIRKEYHSHLQDLDDNQYYTKIDRTHLSQSTLAAQDYWLANQPLALCRSTEELKRIFGRVRGQARREELHGH